MYVQYQLRDSCWPKLMLAGCLSIEVVVVCSGVLSIQTFPATCGMDQAWRGHEPIQRD